MKDCQDAATHREPKWPLFGYAPGGYMSKCLACEGLFTNMDKRAHMCLPCAVEAVGPAFEGMKVRMRALEDENQTLRAAIQIVQPAPSVL